MAPNTVDPPTRRRRTNRLEEVHSAAARLFFEKGYEATSIQDVADAVGILKGSLYYYIDSKEDLLYAVIEDAHANLLRILAEVASSEEPPTVKIRQLVTRHCVYVAENVWATGVFLGNFRALTGERRERILRERDDYEKGWRQILMEGQHAGAFRSDVDPRVATRGILGMANGVHQWFKSGASMTPAEVGTQFADLIMSGIVSADD